MNENHTDWNSIKSILNELSYSLYYIGTSAPYLVITGDRFNYYRGFISNSSDITDFENNYKSNATNISTISLAISTIANGIHHIFNNKTLADGVYEDSNVMGCDFSKKTFNIENKHATGALYFKIWGSPNNTDYEEIKEETLLSAQTKMTIVNNDMWKFVKISAQGSGSVSTIDAYLQVGQ